MAKSDVLIIKEILNGSIEPFKELIERHEHGIMTVLANRLPHNAVEDVAQDVFIKAFRSLDKFKGTAPFSHWVKKIALRCCYDYWRATYRRKEHEITSISEEQQQWLELCGTQNAIDEIERMADKEEAKELLEITMNLLKPIDRVLIDMIYFNHMTMKEAAEAMNSNVMLIKVRASRARKKMRTIIESLVNNEVPQ